MLTELIQFNTPPVYPMLPTLLKNKTTGKNIIWATNSYAKKGPYYQSNVPIDKNCLTGQDEKALKPRVLKALCDQQQRTKSHAEVFTPTFICALMNNACDEAWFDQKDVFGTVQDRVWTPSDQPVAFPKGKTWQRYVDCRRLEITCGEAPFIVTRYDTSTGDIIPLPCRCGFLDRKLRVVTENAQDEKEWLRWAVRAFESTYGYEYQGDSLLIARVNLLMTFCEYLEDRLKRRPTERELLKVANIISWNIWQMDGLTGRVPLTALENRHQQVGMAVVEARFSGNDGAQAESAPECNIYDWRSKCSVPFKAIGKGECSMKFDFVIGNPPYQEETVGDQKTFAPPIYNLFMEEAYKVGRVVELIHPARFLFNAGGTPKEWNQKMLNDPHFKVLFHEQDSSKVFVNTDIKGGVAITYRDVSKDFGALVTYTAFPELNGILKKVTSTNDFQSLSKIIANRGLYRFSKLAYEEHPTEMAKVTDSRIGASVFERMPKLFTESIPEDKHVYVQFYGLLNAKRVFRWFRRDYFKPVNSFEKYKVFIPAANGSGALGEVLSTPVIGQPVIGHTETFISVGAFDTEQEAGACYNYICSKFCRVMLGVLKITQHNSPEKWKYVPLQDFTPASDIDWSQSVADIDRQLYRKYNLDDGEIEFIETHVKEMN